MNDCNDGEDEVGCTTVNPNHQMQSTPDWANQNATTEGWYDCGNDGFYCTSGRFRRDACILNYWVCDGMNDCAGGEDEANCKLSD